MNITVFFAIVFVGSWISQVAIAVEPMYYVWTLSRCTTLSTDSWMTVNSIDPAYMI
jgi:hypothetical protein